MTVNYTTLLALGQPVTGTQTGTWGDDVNNSITSYLDIAIAGTLSLTSASFTAGALTLANTQGTNTATNIGSTTAQYAVLRISSLAVNSTITAPSSSRIYLVDNADATYTVTIKASGQSGYTVATNTRAWVYYNGTDYVLASTNDVSKLIGVLAAANGGTGQSSYTTGDILYASGATALAKLAGVATGNALISGGVGAAPSYGKIGLTTHVSGTLPIASGGTGLTTIAARSIFVANALDTLTTVTPSAGQSIRVNASNTAWESYTPSAGDVVAANSNAFTGANTFYNATGQTFGTATSTQDGIIIAGRAGGSSSYRVTFQPGTLTASRTLTAPDASTTIVGTDATQTLSNKRIDPRAVAASGTTGTLTPNGDTTDVYLALGLTGPVTFAAPSGTPVNGQKLIIRVKDDGTARALTWTTTSGAFRALGITLPTTTAAGKTTYVGCIYNTADSFWDAVATVTQA